MVYNFLSRLGADFIKTWLFTMLDYIIDANFVVY